MKTLVSCCAALVLVGCSDPASDGQPSGPNGALGDDSGTPLVDGGAAPSPGSVDGGAPTQPPAPAAPGDPVYGKRCTTMTAEQESSWKAIARLRGEMRLPAMDCDDAIQKAAQAHADYCAKNGTFAHDEDPAKPGFTGRSPPERMRAAGFTGPTGYEVGGGPPDLFMASIIHRQPFINPKTRSYGYAGVWMDYGYDAKPVPPTFLSSYPADGGKLPGVSFSPSSESPNPLPDRQLVGYPLSLIGGGPIALSEHVLAGPHWEGHEGASVEHLVMAPRGDHIPFIVPTAPLTRPLADPVTRKPPAVVWYTLRVKGTVSGSPFERTFRFNM